MALIQCPDCGAQVSSNAPRCVHCGCVFTACPECGAVYAGKAETCRSCGYKISPAFEVKNEYTKMDYAKSGYGENTTLAWKRKADGSGVIMKYITYFQLLMLAAVAVLTIVAFFKFKNWPEIDASVSLKELEKSLTAMKNFKTDTMTLARWGCILGAAVPIISMTKTVFFQLSCASWMAANKADVAAIVKRADSKVDVSEEEQETETFDNVSSAAYLSLVPNDRGRKIARLFLTVVVAVAVAFFLFKGIGENVDAFMASKGVPADLDSWFSASAGSFEESSFEFQYKTLIVAGAILATGKSVGALMDVSFSKRKNNWLSKIK